MLDSSQNLKQAETLTQEKILNIYDAKHAKKVIDAFNSYFSEIDIDKTENEKIWNDYAEFYKRYKVRRKKENSQ